MKIRFNKTLTDYFYVIFGNGSARFVSMLNTVLVARLLGPSFYGVFTIFYAVMILTWQLPVAFDTSFVASAKTCSSEKEKNDFLKATIILKIAFVLLAVVFSYWIAHLVANYSRKPEAFVPAVAAIGCGVFQTFLMTVASTFQEQEKFGHYAALNVVYNLLIFGCLVFPWLLGSELSIPFVLAVYFGMSVLVGLISFVILLRRVGHLFELDRHVFATAFQQGKWIFGCAIAFYFFARIDILFLTRYLDLEMLGIYGVGAALVMVVGLMTTAMAGVCLPKAAVAVRSREDFRTFAKESLWAAGLVNIGIVALMIAARFLIVTIYGMEYEPAAPVLRILLGGWLIGVVFVPFSFLFYAIGQYRTRFVLEASKLAIGIVLLLFLVPQFGYIGGAVAITITVVLNTFASFAVLAFKLNKTHREVVPW